MESEPNNGPAIETVAGVPCEACEHLRENRALRNIAGQVTEANALASRVITELAETRQELEQRERALLEQSQLFHDAVERAEACQRAFAGAAMGIAVIDLNGRFTHVNAALCRLTGYSAAELYETAFGALTHPDDVPANVQLLQQLMEEDAFGLVAECRLVRRNGDTVAVRNSISLQLSKGRPANIIVLVEDISEQKRAQQQLAHQATHDLLTGLPNRRLFADRLEQSLASARRHGWLVALLYIDLDGFKLVNDTMGHSTGDVLLQRVVRRLASRVRETDTLARMGGDEFTLVAGELTDMAAVHVLADKLLGSFRTPFQLKGYELFVGASMGIAVYPQDGEDVNALLRNADAAMYEAKRRGKNRYQAFTPDMSDAAVERLELENNLRAALDRSELVVYYQPQFSLTTNRVVRFEALLRWNHPRLGLISPDKFIPIAEESGLIIPIGDWVLHEACRQIREWSAASLRGIKVGVNVSAVQFGRADFVASVAQALENTGLEPERLELELTETFVMHDFEESESKIIQLRKLGVGVSIDDFGTGYSSLNYLQRLPIDAVKIDRSFVRDIASSNKSRSLMQGMASLAHSLGMRVVVEGVETPEQLQIIRSLGCDEVQGFLLGRPGPPETIQAHHGLRLDPDPVAARAVLAGVAGDPDTILPC
jgi:diguanylate cyclase (GGDEF)-like protein/PAS domain S-box-containing protein